MGFWDWITQTSSNVKETISGLFSKEETQVPTAPQSYSPVSKQKFYETLTGEKTGKQVFLEQLGVPQKPTVPAPSTPMSISPTILSSYYTPEEVQSYAQAGLLITQAKPMIKDIEKQEAQIQPSGEYILTEPSQEQISYLEEKGISYVPTDEGIKLSGSSALQMLQFQKEDIERARQQAQKITSGVQEYIHLQQKPSDAEIYKDYVKYKPEQPVSPFLTIGGKRTVTTSETPEIIDIKQQVSAFETQMLSLAGYPLTTIKKMTPTEKFLATSGLTYFQDISPAGYTIGVIEQPSKEFEKGRIIGADIEKGGFVSSPMSVSDEPYYTKFLLPEFMSPEWKQATWYATESFIHGFGMARISSPYQAMIGRIPTARTGLELEGIYRIEKAYAGEKSWISGFGNIEPYGRPISYGQMEGFQIAGLSQTTGKDIQQLTGYKGYLIEKPYQTGYGLSTTITKTPEQIQIGKDVYKFTDITLPRGISRVYTAPEGYRYTITDVGSTIYTGDISPFSSQFLGTYESTQAGIGARADIFRTPTKNIYGIKFEAQHLRWGDYISGTGTIADVSTLFAEPTKVVTFTGTKTTPTRTVSDIWQTSQQMQKQTQEPSEFISSKTLTKMPTLSGISGTSQQMQEQTQETSNLIANKVLTETLPVSLVKTGQNYMTLQAPYEYSGKGLTGIQMPEELKKQEYQQFQGTILSPDIKSLQKNLPMSLTKQPEVIKTLQIPIQKQEELSMQKITQIQLTELETVRDIIEPIVSSPPVPVTPLIPPKTPFVPLLPIIPQFAPSLQKPRSRRIKTTRVRGYRPSLGAVVFDIRKVGEIPSPEQVFTGLETRPIIVPKRTKRKKSRKKKR